MDFPVGNYFCVASLCSVIEGSVPGHILRWTSLRTWCRFRSAKRNNPDSFILYSRSDLVIPSAETENAVSRRTAVGGFMVALLLRKP